MNENKIKLIQSIIESAQHSLSKAQSLLNEMQSGNMIVNEDDLDNLVTDPSQDSFSQNGEIIEGVFDGYQMIGPDGAQYSIPANYASKSKLVEGDLLKLTISPDGSFIYKQIRPIDRERLKGKLVKDKEKNEFRVLVDKKLYKILLASVTYYKGEVGDDVIILVPNGGASDWAAVDNIIKRGSNGHDMPDDSSYDDYQQDSEADVQDDEDPFADIFEE